MKPQLVLLPQPQKLNLTAGVFRPAPERLVALEGLKGDQTLAVGRAIRQSLERIGGPGQLTAARGTDRAQLGVIVRVDPATMGPAESYRLEIRPDLIQVTAKDAAGAFYAAMTLRQLARQAEDGSLPCLRIEDWPDFPARGVMLDISRDRVPTMETLRWLIDLLAEWKINQFQLYTEHTFAYRNHRRVWEKASPVTGEEILELDQYCRERFVELVPNQNSFGHWERWLKHPPYRHLAEAPDGFEWPWGGRSTHGTTLCPIEPGAVEILRELYDELLPHFSSRQINVGCDETWELGKGRSRQACEQQGTGAVYLGFLRQIHDLVQRHGRTMQFWGDIILHHPELIPQLPEGVIALEWGYEAGHPFAVNGQEFASAGVPFYVCPGTSSWLTLAGRTENAKGNLWNAAANGRKHGAVGFLNTNWGDGGHFEPPPISFVGYAYGAAVSWAGRANQNLDLPAVLDRHAFLDSAAVMGKLVCDLGNVYLIAATANSNSAMFTRALLNPNAPTVKGRLCEATLPRLRKAIDQIDEITAPLAQARMQRPDAKLVTAEYRQTAALMKHACRLAIARLEVSAKTTADVPAVTRRRLARELAPLLPEYRRLWRLRSRPGGLADSVGRLEVLQEIYRR